MWPLLVFSIITVTITLERLIFFLHYNLRIDDIAENVSVFAQKCDFGGAHEYLSSLTRRRMGACVLLALIKHIRLGRSFSRESSEKDAEAEAMKCINSLENGLNFLTALGSISPLTGFLGTVTGMIGAFRSIAQASEVNAQIVANGIYEALITTVFGLVIAIIAMISHSVFSHIIDRFAAKTEIVCSFLIAQLSDFQTEKSINQNTKTETGI